MTNPDRIAKGMYWDRAWSLVSGCTHVSPGCDNCWSAKETHMRANNPNEKVKARNEGLTDKGCFTGQIRFNREFLDLPLRVKKPTVFAIWNDLFHEDVPFEFISEVFARMWAADWHTYLLLTKRPERMREFICGYLPEVISDTTPSPHIWLGTTCENQEMADKRIPILLQTPAAIRWVSYEPALGPVDLREWMADCGCVECQRKYFTDLDELDLPEDDNAKCMECGGDIVSFSSYCSDPGIDWVVCGGESGPGARPCHPDWIRSLRDQCQAAGVPFFFKQFGEWREACLPDDEIWNGKPPKLLQAHGAYFVRLGKKAAGRILDGRTYDEFPERC